MTAFTKPSFSVNPSAAKAPKDCRHGWINEKRDCVLCGAKGIVKADRPYRRVATATATPCVSADFSKPEDWG